MRRALSRRRIMLTATTAMLAFAWVAAPANALQLGLPESHSPNADAISGTYWVMLVIATILIVAINVALILAVVRFRERRGREAAQVHAGRGALRPVIGALSVLALAVFVFGVVRTGDVRSIEPSGPNGLGASATAQVGISDLEPSDDSASVGAETGGDADPAQSSPLVINAIAQQWLWRFEYPGGRPGDRTFSYGELVVPVDTPVILNVSSVDVLHSWWVPALGGQVQATPGVEAETWFKADEVGVYSGQSTIFSGSAYPAMRSWVRVVTVPEYQDHIQRLTDEIHSAQEIVEREQPPVGAESE
jgi:cytochrome c oxidase subunit 2